MLKVLAVLTMASSCYAVQGALTPYSCSTDGLAQLPSLERVAARLRPPSPPAGLDGCSSYGGAGVSVQLPPGPVEPLHARLTTLYGCAPPASTDGTDLRTGCEAEGLRFTVDVDPTTVGTSVYLQLVE